MSDTLKGFNDLRSEGRQKPKDNENFLQKLNENLIDFEASQNEPVDHSLPLIFVVGLPRSGTTFCTQVIQQAFDLGYINNLMARFWLAPVTGVKLSQQLIGDATFDEVASDYAATRGLEGIHEFGYFWRYWLKKESADDFITYSEKEDDIEWKKLNQILGSIRHAIGKPIIMKNNFGGFHIDRILDEIPNSLFIHIEREQVSNAVSILEARKAFFSNPDTWWSTITPNYNQIKNKPVHSQIVEQIKALKSVYTRQMNSKNNTGRKLSINYEALSSNPGNVLEEIQQLVMNSLNYELRLSKADFDVSPRKHLTHPEAEIFRSLFNE